MSSSESLPTSRSRRLIWLRRGHRKYVVGWLGLALAITSALLLLIAVLEPKPSMLFEHTSVIWQSHKRIDVVIDFRHDGTCVKGIWEQWIAGPKGDHFLIAPPREVLTDDPKIHRERSGGGHYFGAQIALARNLGFGDYLYQGRFTCIDAPGGQQLFVTEWRPFHIPSSDMLDAEM